METKRLKQPHNLSGSLCAQRTRSRGKANARIAVLQQGHLDALCGVYATINAVNNIVRLRDEQRRDFFKELVLSLDAHANLSKLLYEGTFRKHIQILMKAAKFYAAKELGRVLLVDKPFEKAARKTNINGYWSTLLQFFHEQDDYEQRRSAIIGISKRHDHWTCVSNATPFALHFIDSDGLTRIDRFKATSGDSVKDKIHQLNPQDVWFLKAEKLRS